MTILRFKVPGPDDPGYLRRMREGLRFRDQLAGGEPTPEMIEEMAKFLATYVTEPADYAARGEAMLDARASAVGRITGRTGSRQRGRAETRTGDRSGAEMADTSRKLEIIIEGDDRTKGAFTGIKSALSGLGGLATKGPAIGAGGGGGVVV